jgi:large subunit ribosomal protein L24
MIIRKGDTVRVITGDDAGTTSRVLRVLRSDNKVVVEGVNKVYKHLKPSRNNPQGGRLSKEMPIDVSNVMMIDPSTNQPTRVGIRVLPDGTKERFAKKSGASLGRIGRPKTKA